MARSRTDKILEDWKLVAQQAPRPAEAPRSRSRRDSGPIGLLAAGAVIVLLVLALSLRAAGQGPQPTQPAVGANPSAPASPSATAAVTPATSPAASPAPSVGALDAVSSIVDAYTRDLVRKDYAAAWALLAPDGPSRSQSFSAWSAERGQFFVKVAGRYTIVESPTDVAPLSNWLASPWGASIDTVHAVLIEVDYPSLAGNNAGYDLYIVNPTATGLEIYDVR